MANKLWENPATQEFHREKAKRQWQDPAFRERAITNSIAVGQRRMKENPGFMVELTEKAKIALRENWRHSDYKDKVIRSKILGFVNVLTKKYPVITQEIYEKERYNNCFPKFENALNYFESFSELTEQAKNYNHKIVSIKVLEEKEDVYDLTCDPWHNFLLSAGVFVHNSIDGDSASAMRYSEAKLSAIGEEMLADIEKNTVNFVDNYDGTRQEPAVLPSPLPQLLLNGSFGIAVGMATSIPTHNTSEVLQSTIHLLDNPQAATEDLFQFFQGPDFPTGGIIYGKKDIIAAYSQGKGPILTRGKAEIEETKKGNSIIVITEIPFQVQKSAMVMQMAKLVEDKRVEGIKDIRDESDREGMRVVIELKKEAFPKKVLNALFKYTDLQKTFHLNMIALVDGIQPRVLGLVDVLSFYLKHKEEVVVRRTKYDLQKAKERAHILEGLMMALDNIDEVIKVIKQSASRDDAKINLQKKFKFTDIQAAAILEMRLAQLAKLERDKIEKELAEIEKLIKELNLILSNPKKLKELIKTELQAMAEKYKDNRRTKVVAGRLGEIGDEDLIPQEEAIITITQGGFIKRMKSSVYHTQKRGGKGVAGMEVNEEDIVEHFVVANTLDKMMFFTDSGKIFQCFAWEIPELTRISKGRGLLNFIEIAPQDKVLSLISYTKKDEDLVDKFLVMVTKDGIIKKTILSAFKNVRKNGLLAVKLQPGDSLRSAKIADKDDEISLITKNGQSIRFKESDVRPMGRGASGVKGMKIGKEDEVIAMDVIKLKTKNEKLKVGEGKGYLLVITENGYGKRTPVEEYRLQKRGGSGIKAAKINEKTGKIVFAKILEPDDED
ncbi:MAG: DNA gyrase subunit A, partial [Patescibacteria group bacterium]